MMEKDNNQAEQSAPLYYCITAALSLTWPFLYIPKYFIPLSYISHSSQILVIYGALYLLDSYFMSKKIKFALAGIALIYTFQILFNAMVMSTTSITFFESLSIFALGGKTDDFFLTLAEAGFPAAALFGFLLGLAFLLAAGGYLRGKITRFELKDTAGKAVNAFIVVMAMAFITEQFFSKNNPDYFARREFPLYLQIFSGNRETLKVKIPESRNETQAKNSLKNIGKPAHPRNIVMIVLESFRNDMVDRKFAPNLYALSRESLEFSKLYGDSIYTSLTWNVLFMDRPAFTLDVDVKSFTPESPGSFPVKILKKAGYRAYISSSTKFEWSSIYRRITGREKLIDRYFCANSQFPGIDRNRLDNLAAEKAVSWIKTQKAEEPFFLILQLDSTHWAYYFDNNAEIFRPYPQKINIMKLSKQEDIEPVFNRYKNAVRQVDNKIGELIKALKERGIFENTVIAVISDHGEGFAPGRIGHSVFHEDITKPPVVMRLPGIGRKKITFPAAHRDILPTIFDYLKVPGVRDDFFIGRTVLKEQKADRPLLIFHGSLLFAELVGPDYTVLFRADVSRKEVKLTPYRYLYKDQSVIPEMKRDQYKILWQEAVKNYIEKTK